MVPAAALTAHESVYAASAQRSTGSRPTTSLRGPSRSCSTPYDAVSDLSVGSDGMYVSIVSGARATSEHSCAMTPTEAMHATPSPPAERARVSNSLMFCGCSRSLAS
eukprot:3782682-Pleurochrysis_carterae.AAC.3